MRGAIAEAALDATYLGQQPVACAAMYTVGLLGAGAVVVLPRLRENTSNRVSEADSAAPQQRMVSFGYCTYMCRRDRTSVICCDDHIEPG